MSTQEKSPYKVSSSSEYPKIGNFIHYHLYINKINRNKVVEEIGIHRSTFSNYLKQESLQFGIIWKISKIVNYNFLAHLSEYLKIPYETKREKELLAELSQKEDEIKILKAQLEVYQKIHKMGN